MKHSQHMQTYTIAPKESRTQDVIITVACIAVFALWGVLLAMGV